MKKMSKVFTGLAAMAMVVSLVMPVQAKGYNYTFRLSAGTQGVLDSSDSFEFTDNATVKFEPFETGDAGSNNPQGGTITVTAAGSEPKTYTVTIPADAGSKYYVKGIRKSGRDKVENQLANVTISKDTDYIVAYGVMKNPVQYTIYYQDTSGRNLLDPKTFTASVGDKPVVACQDIDGYMPNALNMTGTLKADAASNVFTFVYSPMPGSSGGVVTNEETETVTNTTTQVVPGEGAEAGAEGGAAGGVTVVPGEGGDAQAEAGGEAAGEEAAGAEETPAEPQELIDLDDEEVPLANVPGAAGNAVGTEPGSFFVNMPPAVIVGVVSMAVLAVAAAWYLLFMKKKRTNTGNEEK